LLSFSLRRTLLAIPLLLGVATLVFFVLSLAPGDAASIYLRPGMTPETLEHIRRSMGLDDPLLIRYGRWILAFLQGDFGYSHFYQMPVRDRILAALPNTLILASGALFFAFLVGILVGVLQAVKEGSFRPGADLLAPWDQFRDRIHHLVLPTLTLTLILAGGVARYVRTSMLDVIRQDYIRTARAKGLPETRVIMKHGLRNGLIPVVTLFGVYFPFLLSGTVLIEYVFAWPGMGQLMVESILRKDLPVVLAGTFLFGGMVVLGNLLADLLYGVVDPRIRQSDG
jgi:peptide/nickel transport system permease protein